MNRSQLLFFSYGNPCRSETPSINTRRSDISQFRQDFWKKVLESLLQPNHGEKRKIWWWKKKKKWKGRVSVFYTCRRSFQVQSCGQAMAPAMLLQRGGAPRCVIFLFISPPSARKVGGAKEKEKEREINVHPLLPMVEMFLSKSQGRNYAHLKKCSRKYLMQTSELVVHSTALHEAEAGHKRVSQ